MLQEISFDKSVEILLSTGDGKCLIIDGGWLERLFMCTG